MTVVAAVHDMNVSLSERPNYSLIIQNPASFT